MTALNRERPDIKMTEVLNLTQSSAVNLMILYGIIQESTICPVCSSVVILNMENFIFRCSKRTVRSAGCNFKKMAFSGSFFSYSKLPFPKIFQIVYLWFLKVPQELTSYELEVESGTLSFWNTKIRMVATLSYINDESQVVGGEDKIVEIDECLLARRKNRRGRQLAGESRWLVGGIERDSNKCFFQFVDSRDRDTLDEIIVRSVAPGSTIITDGWAAYSGIDTRYPDRNYNHLVVNHTDNFVDPDTGAHTNGIEGFWSVLKRYLRKSGSNRGSERCQLLKIFELLYRRSHRTQTFNQIILDLNKYNELSALMEESLTNMNEN